MYRGLYSAVMVELVSDANYVLTRLAVEIERLSSSHYCFQL